MLKRLFSKGSPEPAELTIDELIILERYGEAEGKLKEHLKRNSGDQASRQKLAETLTALGRNTDAGEEFLTLGEQLTRDGFYRRAHPFLTRAERLMPAEPRVAKAIRRFEAAREREEQRKEVLEGLRSMGMSGGTIALSIQKAWSDIAASTLVQRLEADSLQRFFGACHLSYWKEGQVVVKAQMQEPSAFFVLSGSVGAFLPEAGDNAAPLKTFEAGDLIGDRALMEKQPWPATYRVLKAGQALCLDREGLEKAMHGNSDPRGLLMALREQRSDLSVVELLMHQAGPSA